jgi:Phage integrase, N-terminal SAM-like domain
MLEELERRNYAQTTIDCYIRTVEPFSRYFHRSPEQLGPQHIREYQAALFKKWKLAPNTVNQRLAALRFFYIQTLKRAWSVAETPYPKKVLKLPIILSQEEVARLINSALTPFHRIVLMTLYATGVRRAELARLKISGYGVIHIKDQQYKIPPDPNGEPDAQQPAVQSRHLLLKAITPGALNFTLVGPELLIQSFFKFLTVFTVSTLPIGVVEPPLQRWPALRAQHYRGTLPVIFHTFFTSCTLLRSYRPRSHSRPP